MKTYDVGQKQFGGVFAVVPVTMINPLPQQLNRWLCAILLFRRHIQVIHKRYAFLAERRTEHTLSTPTLM